MKNLLFVVLFVLSHVASAKTETFFSPESDLQAVIMSELEKAQKSIDVSIYTFTSKKIRNLLIEKMNAGVKVRVVINNGGKQTVKDFVKPLQDNGATVKYITKINHHKYIIVDNQVLLNSSGNFATSALFKKFDENLVVCDTCVEHIKAFGDEFDQMVKFSNFSFASETRVNQKPSETEKSMPVNESVFGVALFSSENFKPYFSRGKVRMRANRHDDRGMGAVDSMMVEFIDAAKTSLDVATGHLRSKPLYDALVRAQERGVKVNLVLDGQEYISKSKQAKEKAKVAKCMETKSYVDCHKKGLHYGRLAAKAGINVLFKYNLYRWHFPYSEQMHHKYMVVDSAVVLTGSYNWSYNAEFNTLENVAIFTEASVTKDFLRNFKSLQTYGGASAGYERMMSEIRSAKGSIPTVFPPVSLTVEQIDTLKRAAFNKCKRLYTNPVESRSCKF